MPVNPTLGHRQRQAEATKRQVAEAARAVFAERGYGATTIKAISEAADIPVPTIYSAFGSKAKILAKVTDLWMVESRTADLARASLAEPDPAQQLRLFAELNRRQLEAGADIVAIYQEAARADPDMAAVLGKILGAREKEIRKLITSIAHALSPGTTIEDALDTTLVLTLPEAHATLVKDRGWTGDRYETWLGDSLIRLLLVSDDSRRV